MNKEELRKEAYLFAKNSKDVQNFECGFDIAFKSYLAAAEPREKHIKELERSCDETQELLDKQIEVTCKLDQENAELKSECRRCVYTDSPCVLSDYGKDKNGICDHFKDVFDENAELKKKFNVFSNESANACFAHNKKAKQLAQAKDLIRALLKHTYGQNLKTQNDFDLYLGRIKEAEQFLNSEVEK